MRIATICTILLLVLGLTVSIGACSKNKSPIEPSNDSLVAPILPGESNESNRDLIAVYDATIDLENKTFSIEPVGRTNAFHYPLSNSFPNVLKIVSYNFGPPFTAQIKLTHPFPTSSIAAYDPRVIACLPARTGVSASFPSLGFLTNNKTLQDPDGYTKLWDNTSIPGNANPFKAYFMDKPNRVWSAAYGTVETKKWTLDLAGFGGSIQFQLVVDVSTNYPNPPTPGTDNCPEPFDVEVQFGDGLTQTGGSCSVDVYAFDWQGQSGIGGVKIEAPSLFIGAVDLSYIAPGPYLNSYRYSGTIKNEKYAPIGYYNMLVGAWDQATNVYYYDIVLARVKASPANLVDKTPDSLNFSPLDVCVNGNYAYVAGGVNGLHIFDVTDPYHPSWLSRFKLSGPIMNVFSTSTYAYVIDYSMGLIILSIADPSAPTPAGIVSLPSPGMDVNAINGYAYVATDTNGLQIIDVDPPQSAYIVKSISLPKTRDVFIDPAEPTHAYVADHSAGLKILSIANPPSAKVLNDGSATQGCDDVVVSGSTAYILNEYNRAMFIWEIFNNYSTLYQMHEYYPTGTPTSLCINEGECVYITEANRPSQTEGHIQVVDITTMPNPELVKTIDIPGNAQMVWMSGIFAYVADDLSGLYILNAYYAVSPSIISKVETLGQSYAVQANADYAYVADGFAGLRIVDINPPENASIVNTVNTPGWARDVCLLGDYAYVADGAAGVQIITISNPQSAYIVKTIDTLGSAVGIYALAGYAYVADESAGVQIMDVDPISSASIIKTVDTPGKAEDVVLGPARLFVADYNNGFVVINITSIPSAYISKTVALSSYANAVTLSGAYVYVANESNGVQIIDISTPESAYVNCTIDTPGYAQDVFVWDDYLYVADLQEGLHLIDVNDPDSPFLMDTAHMPGPAEGVFVRGQMVYVGSNYGGLRIFSAW